MSSTTSTIADKILTSLSGFAFAIGSVGFAAKFCTFNVDGGEKAVMWKVLGGVSESVYGEGTHFTMPYFMRPHIYNIRLRPKLIQTTTGTKDLQMATIHMRLLYKPEPSSLPHIHKNLGPDYDERVLPSVGNEVLKSIVAQYNAEHLLTKREQVSKEIRKAIIERCRAFDILLDDVAITHLNYGKEFAKAIEEKQVAEQDAEKQKFIVARSEQEKKANITRAQGEAEAALMISEALREHGSGLIEVRRIDTAREIAKILSNSANVMYLPNKQNTFLNVGNVGGR